MITTVLIPDENYYSFGSGCVDAQGYPHFVMSEWRSLVHIYLDGTEWRHERVFDKESGSVFGSAIGVFDGKVHIATIYRQGSYPNYSYSLLYNTNETGEWVEEIVWSGATQLAKYCYMDISISGEINIVWAIHTTFPYTRSIKRTYGTGNAWVTEDVLIDTVRYWHQLSTFRIRVGVEGIPHVIATTATDVVVLKKSSGVWVSETLETDIAAYIAGVELLIEDGIVHAWYVNDVTGLLKYTYNNGVWSNPVAIGSTFDGFQSYMWAGAGAGMLHVIGADYGPNPGVPWEGFVRHYEYNDEWTGGEPLDAGDYEIYDFAFTASARGWFMLYSPENMYVGLIVTYEPIDIPEPPPPGPSGDTAFGMLVGPLRIYVAPVGTPAPSVTETLALPWVYLGETTGDQVITHGGGLQYLWDNEHQGPRKALRAGEQRQVHFSLVGLTLETYARILHQIGNVAPVSAEIKRLPMERGLVLQACALLLRGEVLSPYGAWPGYFLFERGVFAGEPQLVWASDKRVALECEYGTFDDAGSLVVQAAQKRAGTCLEVGTPQPALMALANTAASGMSLECVGVDETYIFAGFNDSAGKGLLRIRYRADGAMLTGELEVDATARLTLTTPYAGVLSCAVGTDYVYVGTDAGLIIVDKATFEQVGVCENVGGQAYWFMYNTVLSNDERYVFGGGPYSGWAVFDVQDPENPATISVDTEQMGDYLAFDGRYLYVASYSDTSFSVYDMLDPETPVLLFSSETLTVGSNDVAWPSAVKGDLLALGEFDEDTHTALGVGLFDVANKAAVSKLLTVQLPETGDGAKARVYSVMLVGKHLVVATGYYFSHPPYDTYSLLHFFDVGAPSVLVETLAFAHRPNVRPIAQAFDERYMVIADVNAVLVVDGCAHDVVEVTDCGRLYPRALAWHDPQGGLPEAVEAVWGVAVGGDYAYFVHDSAVGVSVTRFRIRDAEGTMLTGALDADLSNTYRAANNYEGVQCAVQGGYVYVADTRGLFILDVLTLQVVGSCTNIALGWNDAPFLQHVLLSADGRYLFSGGSGFGIAIFDVQTPETPVCIAYDGTVDCEDLLYAAASELLIVIDDNWKYAVYDVSTPVLPVKTVVVEDLFSGDDFPSSGDWRGAMAAFSNASNSEVRLYNVSTPTAPVLLSTFTLTIPVKVRWMRFVGSEWLVIAAQVTSNNLLYVLVLNISDPEQPFLQTQTDVGIFDRDIGLRNIFFTVVDERYLVVSDCRPGYLVVIDCFSGCN